MNTKIDTNEITNIIVACNAGVGASAMGASILAKKIKAAGLNIKVTNCAIKNLPSDVDIVVTHKDFTAAAIEHAGQAKHLSLTNFLDSKFYDRLVEELTTA